MGLMKSKYDCHGCANSGSPLCELCGALGSVGAEGVPKYYVDLSDVLPRFLKAGEGEDNGTSRRRPLREGGGDECAVLIEYYLRAGEALPMAVVLDYNEQVRKRKILNEK